MLVCSVDGKGIVMRPDALRPATAKAADTATTKLRTRLSKGGNRTANGWPRSAPSTTPHPVPRTAADILAGSGQPHQPAPVAVDKWLTASVIDDAATVISAVFDEADRRNPNHQLTRIALVDGNNHQIDRIHTEAAARGIDVTIIVDFIHVLEYLWDAARCFHDEADPAAETWVRDRPRPSSTTTPAPSPAASAAAPPETDSPNPNARPTDTCADYLTDKAPFLNYSRALQSGWPIATGVIEGACRHLVKDRLDITGARWGLTGAEAILKLRALHSNGDFEHLLAVPPPTRTQPSPPDSLPRRPNPKGRMTSLQKSTLFIWLFVLGAPRAVG